MKYRLLRLPDSIEACHDLINILVAELNEYHDAMRPNDKEDSYRAATVKEFPVAPEQLFPTAHCAGANGGVEFENQQGYRPRAAQDEKFRGSEIAPAGIHYGQFPL